MDLQTNCLHSPKYLIGQKRCSRQTRELLLFCNVISNLIASPSCTRSATSFIGMMPVDPFSLEPDVFNPSQCRRSHRVPGKFHRHARRVRNTSADRGFLNTNEANLHPTRLQLPASIESAQMISGAS